MSIRIIAYIECDECHDHFEQILSLKGTSTNELASETHDLVISAEADNWQCRKNATEHICDHCLEPWTR